jgi:hypothetical protein
MAHDDGSVRECIVTLVEDEGLSASAAGGWYSVPEWVHAWEEMNDNCGKIMHEGMMGRDFTIYYFHIQGHYLILEILCEYMFSFTIIGIEIGIYSLLQHH